MNLMNLFRWFVGEKPTDAAPVTFDVKPVAVAVEGGTSVALAPRKRGRCMIAGCSARRMGRGVCIMHYNQVRKAIIRGEMTEQQAIDAKMILPCSMRSKRTVNWEASGLKPKGVKPPPAAINADPSVCIWSGCNKKPHHRGACWGHYNQVRDSILKGQFTEDEAIAAGMVVPGQRRIGWNQPKYRKQSP